MKGIDRLVWVVEKEMCASGGQVMRQMDEDVFWKASRDVRQMVQWLNDRDMGMLVRNQLKQEYETDR